MVHKFKTRRDKMKQKPRRDAVLSQP
jgi:hypothetical protein